MTRPAHEPMADPDVYTADGYPRLAGTKPADVSGLAGNFEAWAKAELDRLGGLLAATDAAARAEALAEIGRLAHDLKGQAGVFGYGLAAQVAQRLSAYIRARETESAAPDITVVELHRRALSAVIAARATGECGEKGRKILEGLARAAGG